MILAVCRTYHGAMSKLGNFGNAGCPVLWVEGVGVLVRRRSKRPPKLKERRQKAEA